MDMKWLLIIGGGFVLVILLMRRQGGASSLVGAGAKKTSSGGLFDDVGTIVKGIKNIFSKPDLTGSELETSSGEIDLSSVYGE